MEVAGDAFLSGTIKILKLYLKASMKGLPHGSLGNLQSELHVDMKAVVKIVWFHGIEKAMVQESHRGLMSGAIGVIAGPLEMIGGSYTGVGAGAGAEVGAGAQLKTQGGNLQEWTGVELNLVFRGKYVGIFLLVGAGEEIIANFFTRMLNFMIVEGH